MNDSASIFSALHQQATTLLLPNAWDAGSARIFESLGAAAIATTSAGVAWSQGYPDGRMMPAKVQAEVARNIMRVIKVPLSVDFENGYSDDPNTVAENIKPLLDAGVAGINIEDGTDAPELLAAKIEAIRKVADSYGSNLFINARTDVYLASLVPAEQRVAEVRIRAEWYAGAGSNGLFVPYLNNEKEIETIAGMTSLPLNVLLMPGLPDAARLATLGVKRLSAGSGISQMVWQQAAALATRFLKDGDAALLDDNDFSYGKLQGFFETSK
jgi:2-methylisocitrate lyase-like PEP mutase family enzyme